MNVDEPRCPIQAFHPQGERRVSAFLDFDLARSGTLARVSEESGLTVSGSCRATTKIAKQSYQAKHHYTNTKRGRPFSTASKPPTTHRGGTSPTDSYHPAAPTAAPRTLPTNRVFRETGSDFCRLRTPARVRHPTNPIFGSLNPSMANTSVTTAPSVALAACPAGRAATHLSVVNPHLARAADEDRCITNSRQSFV